MQGGAAGNSNFRRPLIFSPDFHITRGTKPMFRKLPGDETHNLVTTTPDTAVPVLDRKSVV